MGEEFVAVRERPGLGKVEAAHGQLGEVHKDQARVVGGRQGMGGQDGRLQRQEGERLGRFGRELDESGESIDLQETAQLGVTDHVLLVGRDAEEDGALCQDGVERGSRQQRRDGEDVAVADLSRFFQEGPQLIVTQARQGPNPHA